LKPGRSLFARAATNYQTNPPAGNPFAPIELRPVLGPSYESSPGPLDNAVRLCIIDPMRIFATLTAAVSLFALALVAQDAPKAKGKGGPPKNLKVLPADDKLVPTMQTFVAGLGLADKGGCNFCHVADRSSDEKMEKVMARMMISMVKDINSKFPDGNVHVTCFTCHRGDTEPKTAP
jgi:hypothetical protein